MERAYRQRLDSVRCGLFATAILLLTIVHFTFRPWWPVLAFAAAVLAGLGGWGERVMFSHAWRTFDEPRPSPALEEEARTLARTMGARIGGVRVVSGTRPPSVRWSGSKMIVPIAFRDLPPGERRFRLAQALAEAPDGATRFRRAMIWPTFYAGFSAWAFGYSELAAACLAALILWSVASLVRAFEIDRFRLSRALDATGDAESARTVLVREREKGSPRAARELAELDGLAREAFREGCLDASSGET